MENIELYDIHDTVFEKRPECNQCPSHRGKSVQYAECVQLEAMNHEACPFVEAVQSDIDGMMKLINRDLMTRFIEEVMELNINDKEREEINVYYFRNFIIYNPSLFGEKLTEFFVNRVRDEDNYRGVNVQVS